MWPLSCVLKRTLRKHSPTATSVLEHTSAYATKIRRPTRSSQQSLGKQVVHQNRNKELWFPEQSKCDHFYFTLGHGDVTVPRTAPAEAKLMRKQLIPAQFCSECPHPPDGASGSSGKFQKLSKNEKCVNDLGDPCLLGCRRCFFSLQIKNEWRLRHISLTDSFHYNCLP